MWIHEPGRWVTCVLINFKKQNFLFIFNINIGSVKDRAALFLIKEGVRLNKIAHLQAKDAPPPMIVEGTGILVECDILYRIYEFIFNFT